MLKRIKIAYVDFWRGFDPDKFIFTHILRQHYEIEIDDKDPDFIFCSCFGRKYVKYDCPRIFYAGEPITPDFNVYDYAIGFDPLEYDGRYIQYPLCYVSEETMKFVLEKHIRPAEDIMSRKKFCAMVVSSGAGYKNDRDTIFDELSKYIKVDSGGRYRNNLPDGKGVADKKAFLSDYRFSIAAENSLHDGYITEKIMDAWAAGTIPIFYGSRYSTEMFNPKAFVLADIDNMDATIEEVKRINEDEDAYLKMQREPVFVEGSKWDPTVKKAELENFLVSIFDQSKDEAYRRSSKTSHQALLYEYWIRKWVNFENNSFYKCVQSIKREVFGHKRIE